LNYNYISEKMEKRLARNLQFLRKIHGYTLVELSRLLQISKSALSDYENAKSPPSFDLVYQYCVRFNVDLDAIGSELLEEAKFKAGKYQRLKVNPTDMLIQKQKQALLQQKLDGVEVQLTLLNQLLESRESENKTLKLQIQLLSPGV